MTTPSYEPIEPRDELPTDPLLSGAPEPQHASTPIGDGLTLDAGLDAPTTTPIGTGDPTSSDSSDSSDGAAGTAKEKAADVKEKASNVLGSASDHGSDVADTAKEQVTKVAAEAKGQATDLFADVKSQVDEQSKTQLKNLSSKLGELADEIQQLVSGSETNGPATDVAQQLADRTHQLSSHLESRQPMDLLDDVRTFARRRPAAFLAGAAVAGVVAGRLTKGAKASHAADTSSTPDTSSTTGTDSPVTGESTLPGGTLGGAETVPAGQNTGGRP